MWGTRIAVVFASCQFVLGAAMVDDDQGEEIRKGGARRVVLGTEYPPCVSCAPPSATQERSKTQWDQLCNYQDPTEPNRLMKGFCHKVVCANGYYWTFGGWSETQDCLHGTITPPNPLCPAGAGCVQN